MLWYGERVMLKKCYGMVKESSNVISLKHVMKDNIYSHRCSHIYYEVLDCRI